MDRAARMVLLVEDNPDDALLIRHAFNKAKLPNPLQVVEDGETALEYLSGQGVYADRTRFPIPGLILLDLKLPRKSGFDVLAWIRQQPSLDRLPVVVLTSHKEIPDINDAYDLGANFYLVKSIAFANLREMVQKISDILNRRLERAK